MEQEIIILAEIRIALWILVALMGVIALANIVRVGVICHGKLPKKESSFKDEASELYESGRFEKLIEFCNDHLQDNPEDPYAYWSLGRAYYGKNDYSQANDHFNKTLKLRPLWNKEWVEPYMDQINVKNENH